MPNKVFKLVIDVDARKAKRGAGELDSSFARLNARVAHYTRFAGAAVAVTGALFAGRGVKNALAFDKAITRINTLVGVSVDLTDEWASAMRTLALETAVAGTELAEAMFVITSAGERGAAAMQILEASAKASAVGLGDTASIARTVTAAMQAYKQANLTAAQATDILFATVREGNLEAESLAAAMGPIMGIAAEMGVRFSDLGSALAVYTRLGVTAEQAATGLRATMISLLSPQKDQIKAFNEMGLSVEGLRRQIKEEGLAEALLSISDGARGNAAAMARAIPEARALAAVLGVTGGQADALVDVQGKLRDATGDLADGFGGVQGSAEFRVRRFKVALEELSRALGEVLAPALGTAAAAWAKWITSAVRNIGALSVAWNNSVAGILEGVAKASRAIEAYLRLFRFAFIAPGEHADNAGKMAQTLEDMADVFRDKASTALDAYAESLKQTSAQTNALAVGSVAASTAVEKAGLTAEEAADRMAKLRDVLEGIHERSMAVKDAIKAIVPEIERLDEASVALRDFKMPSVDEVFGEGTEEFLRQQDATAEKAKEIWISFSRSVQASFGDMIHGMLDGNLSSFEDFFDSVFDLFKRMLAEMIAYAIANKILLNVSFGSSFAAAMPSLFGGAASGGLGGWLAGIFGGGAGAGAGVGAGVGGGAIGAGIGGGAVGGGVTGVAAGGGFMAAAMPILMAAAPALAVVGAAVLLKMNKDAKDRKKTTATGSFGQNDAGGFFGSATSYSGHTGTAAQLDASFKEIERIFVDLNETIGGSLKLTERMQINVKGHGKFWLHIYDELGKHMSEQQFNSLEEALTAGVEQLMSSAELSGASDAFAEVLAMTVQDGLEKTMAKIDFLATFDDQLASAAGVVTPAMDSVLQAITALKEGVLALGLSAGETAKLMEKANEAERDRRKELKAGALGDLAGLLERAGIRQMEADRFRAQVEQQLFQLQLKKLEAEFRALNMWNDFLGDIFSDLEHFASKVSNFVSDISAAAAAIDTTAIEYDDWKENRELAMQAARDFIQGMKRTGFSLFAYNLKRQFEEWERRLRLAGGAGPKIIDLIDKLWATYEKALKKAWQAVLEPLRNFQEEMLQGSMSTKSLQQKFFGARSKFFELLDRVKSGDTDAIQELAQAGGQYLELARQMFGTTDRYKQIFDEVYRLIDGILNDDDLMQTAMEFQHEEMMEMLELNGASANELAQMQVDELIKIRREIQSQTKIIWDQTSVLERAEVAA